MNTQEYEGTEQEKMRSQHVAQFMPFFVWQFFLNFGDIK